MKSSDVRSTFLNYFKKNGHEILPSSRLIPEGDDTLLFTNAGMNQFKNTFLGIEKRPYLRATTSQKCVRAGGKHNDLENVGFTARHHTFFEMLGNFSFGDYFKKDAIHFAWELLTRDFNIPKDRLWVTVYTDDDEAADIWHQQEGVPRERISRFEDDNFWRMGETGPCGPCSEIFYDHGEKAGCGKPTCKVGCSCDRFVEIWNLVFMQFFEDGTGTRKLLPKPSVDTGSGLERVSAVMQGVHNNYDTDLFTYLITKSAALSGRSPRESAEATSAMRVLADHARATAFLMADGVLPSNEGRGYVLRRIMRRAIRYGRKLNETKSIFPSLVDAVIENMGDFYPELKSQRSLVLPSVEREEQRFFLTLDQGTDILNHALKEHAQQKKKMLDGELVFKLYDTFGFPMDLTRLMAEEKGLSINEGDFNERMEKARALSQASWKGNAISSSDAHLVEFSNSTPATKFVGYDHLQFEAKVLKLSDGHKEVKSLAKGSSGFVILNQTAFYAEGGGQVGDKGLLTSGSTSVKVFDCTKKGETFLHHVQVVSGTLEAGANVSGQVNQSERRDTAANHSATHLLHAALRKVLGTHVTQAGSLVDSTRLRFDFTHTAAVTALQIEEIENLVNENILHASQVSMKLMKQDEAIKAGALALFGEKYGDTVRVIQMGEFSTELCGGTHVTNTGDIKFFKIVSEGAVSSGVRRIEALTGRVALDYLNKHARENLQARAVAGLQEPWDQFLRDEGVRASIPHWIEEKKNQIKTLEREVRNLKSSQISFDEIAEKAQSFGASKFATLQVDMEDREVLSQIVDRIQNKIKSGVIVVVGKGEKTHPIYVSVTKDLAGKIKAGDLLKEMTAILGGKGGGRPDFAQGAASDLSKLDEALKKVRTHLQG